MATLSWKYLDTIAVLFCILLGQNAVASDACDRTAGMQVYSSAFVHKETGDLLGYDLALERNGDYKINAQFYLYEGGENDEGIPLSGHISNNHVSVQGNWVEHLVEYPSKKEIVQTHFVKIEGIVDSGSFRGELTIEGMEQQEQIRLKRVNRIWACKRWKPSSSR